MSRPRQDTVGSAAKHGDAVHFRTRIEGDDLVGCCSCGAWEAAVPRSVEIPQTVLANAWRQHVRVAHPEFD